MATLTAQADGASGVATTAYYIKPVSMGDVAGAATAAVSISVTATDSYALTATAAAAGAIALDIHAVGGLYATAAGAAGATAVPSVNAQPVMLTINGTRLEVLDGTRVTDDPFGVLERPYGGKANADYRTRNRTAYIVGQYVDVDDWRDVLVQNEVVQIGGALVGESGDFHVRDLEWRVVNAGFVQPIFRLEEVLGTVGLTLYWEAVKQPDNFYVLVRGSNAGYVPEHSSDFYTFSATYPSTYKLGSDADGFVMTGTT